MKTTLLFTFVLLLPILPITALCNDSLSSLDIAERAASALPGYRFVAGDRFLAEGTPTAGFIPQDTFSSLAAYFVLQRNNRSDARLPMDIAKAISEGIASAAKINKGITFGETWNRRVKTDIPDSQFGQYWLSNFTKRDASLRTHVLLLVQVVVLPDKRVGVTVIFTEAKTKNG